MSYRKRMEWPPHVHAALLDDVRLTHEAAQDAKTRFKTRVYLAVEQGLTTYQLAEGLGLSQAVVSKYRIQGEAAFKARQEATEE